MAKASGLDLRYPELERLVTPLEKLEENFRAAVRGLPSMVEPDFVVSAEDENE